MRLTFAFVAVGLVAADWPQWLGPNRDGTSTEAVKPWTEPPKVLWRADVGEGHSSPVVAAGRVYLMDKVPEKDIERLRAFDVADGKQLAKAEAPRTTFASMFGAGPRATPYVAGDGRVLTFGVTGNLASRHLLPRPGGEALKDWNIGLLEQFKASNLRFGVSASPLVEGDKVVALVGGKGASVVAIDSKSGEVVWKALDDAASYAAPIAIDHAGHRVVVCLTGAGVIALDPKDGALLWRHPFRDLLQESSTTPVKVGDLLIASSVTLGSVALKLVEKEGKPAIEQAWKNAQLNCYFSTPVSVGDHLYMVTGVLSRNPSVTLRCVETKTGKVLWSKEKIGKYHAALLRTGDNKLLMHTDGGELMLIDPTPTEYKELAKAKVCGETWAHPALCDGRLYVRDAKELLCLKVSD
ncbi:MAG: PQQ-binding-like beta-propeller repeat protein [Gemmataceae bacterium]